jgi:hypothetical protein
LLLKLNVALAAVFVLVNLTIILKPAANVGVPAVILAVFAAVLAAVEQVA